MNKNLPVFFIMGPTTAGKSSLAMTISKYYPVELISVDSALVYKGMDIGTAKPTLQERKNVPHRLIDIRDPSQSYSAAEFRKDALREIEEVHDKGKLPLLVGGTMLYFKILLEGLSDLPSSNRHIRSLIDNKVKQHGWEKIYCHLQQIDPVAAARIHLNDRQRIKRALEVFLISGKTLTELTQMIDEKLPYPVYQFAILPSNRANLYRRIECRFKEMLTAGFEMEVRKLFAREDLHADLPSIRCVGYRQMWSYLLGEINYSEMTYQSICATNQLAKRQMTWLRKWPNLHWLDSESFNGAVKEVIRVMDALKY